MGDAVTPDLPSPPSPPARYWPDEPFPPYRYVPLGAHPHPTMDVGGHMREHHVSAPLDEPLELAWMTNRFWMMGVDLFNHWYFWEATETWESIWKRLDKDSPDALFLQALMMCAGAILKAQCSEPLGVSAFWQGADERFARVAAYKKGFRAKFWGLRVKKTYRDFQSFFQSPADAAHPLSIDERVPQLILHP